MATPTDLTPPPREQTLPSGGVLKINIAPFSDAKALYKAFFRELRTVQFTSQSDMAAVIKDTLTGAFSSDAIDAALAACVRRCLIDYDGVDQRIVDSMFEPEDRREDYFKVLVEVAKANIYPFGRRLFAAYAEASAAMTALNQEQLSKTMTS